MQEAAVQYGAPPRVAGGKRCRIWDKRGLGLASRELSCAGRGRRGEREREIERETASEV